MLLLFGPCHFNNRVGRKKPVSELQNEIENFCNVRRFHP